MFDKLKQLGQLKALSDSLARERIRVEKEGSFIVVNGKFEVEEVGLSSGLAREEQERVIKDCFNEAVKKVQMAAAQKMSQLGGLGF